MADNFWKEYSAFLKSPQWKAIREKALVRGGNRCYCCKTTVRLQVHHLSYKNWRNPSPSELCILCNMCHKELTIMGRRSRTKGVRLLQDHIRSCCRGRKRLSKRL